MAQKKSRIAIACQGGGALAAFTAGVLKRLIAPDLLNHFELGGLSGTSGGALTACVAWTELLKNGPARVGEALESFWKDNSAQYPWEFLSNAVLVAAASGTVEITLSPYLFPLAFLEAATKLISPRKEFVDLETLIRLHIPVEEMETLARFQALSRELDAFLTAVDGRRLGLSYVRSQNAGPDPEVIRRVAMDMRRLGWVTLKRPVIANQIERIEAIARNFNGSLLTPSAATQMESILNTINSEIPNFLAGAVNVRSGEFEAFNSAHGEIDLNALLASSAVPWVFKAVEGKYWDGLFSQNPPVRNFLTDAQTVEQKPDEIWLVQLASQESPEPITGSEIVTRRAELSSNLSVNQELAAIRALNRRMTQGLFRDPGCKLIAVHWIRLDPSFLHELQLTGAPSAVNRDPTYIEALINHGFDQANAFLPGRAFVEEIWNQADLERRRAAERRWCGADAEHALEIIEAMHRDLDSLHVDVGGMDIGASITFDWTACGVFRANREFVVIRGKAWLKIAGGFVQSARLEHMRFEKVEFLPR